MSLLLIWTEKNRLGPQPGVRGCLDFALLAYYDSKQTKTVIECLFSSITSQLAELIGEGTTVRGESRSLG